MTLLCFLKKFSVRDNPAVCSGRSLRASLPSASAGSVPFGALDLLPVREHPDDGADPGLLEDLLVPEQEVRGGVLGGDLEAAVDVLHEHVPLVGVQLGDGRLDGLGVLDGEQHAQDELKGGVLGQKGSGSEKPWSRIGVTLRADKTFEVSSKSRYIPECTKLLLNHIYY